MTSKRRFFDYLARGVPDGPDDGTIAPWAVVASLPFAPDVVLPTLNYFINHVELKTEHRCGYPGRSEHTRRRARSASSPSRFGRRARPSQDG